MSNNNYCVCARCGGYMHYFSDIGGGDSRCSVCGYHLSVGDIRERESTRKDEENRKAQEYSDWLRSHNFL